MQVRFGDWVVDSSSRQLRRGSEPVRLSPKSYDLLELLVSSGRRALSKAELLQCLWPDTFVVEANLSNLIAEIRAAMGDDARQPRFIRTVHGFGYAFCGVVDEGPSEAEAAPRRASLFWVDCGGSNVQLTEGDHLIGRHPASIMSIDSHTVSRHHAAIRVSAAEATLVDLGSRNGTFLRGQRISSPAILRDGDEIRVGPVVLRFRVASLGETTEIDYTRGPTRAN
jgi:DNA-binding winged helix-turn-helix (wHTH) protein